MKIKFGSHFNLCENVLKSETNTSEDKQTFENDLNRTMTMINNRTMIIEFDSGIGEQGHLFDEVERRWSRASLPFLLIKSDSSIAINQLGKFCRMNCCEELHD